MLLSFIWKDKEELAHIYIVHKRFGPPQIFHTANRKYATRRKKKKKTNIVMQLYIELCLSENEKMKKKKKQERRW